MQRMDALEEENRQMKSTQTAQMKEGGVGAPGSVAVPQISLAVKTPPGKRATTVKIDSLSAVGGLINPGDYVDVLAQLVLPNPIDPKAKPETVTAMIFQNIQVLGIGTNLQIPGQYDIQQRTPELWVTFALDPQETGLVSFAQQNGKVQLVLRSPQETEIRMLQAANWQTLSDYVLEKQGTDISGPRSRAMLEPDTEEVKPYIQIFRGGREL
jgi:Flp pilus assembly protein CpaB